MHRFIQHIRYFFYLAITQNPILALCVLYNEIRGEVKYNINTTAIVQTNKLTIQGIDTSSANEYMPSDYVLLEKVLRELNRYTHNKTFLDIGCGRGRTLIVAAHYGFKDITGVEFIAAHCRHAQQQIKRKEHQFEAVTFHIECMDAVHYTIPGDVQTIFLYNPFNETVIDIVIKNILKSLSKNRRPLFVVYLSPVHKQHFINAGFTEIYHTQQFHFLKASILRLEDKAEKKSSHK
ncbi:MAG: class I SAM-dependent methyltransferase [Flavisolibacter sp.]|nr:class I SAM-dependent methyltransferase [Flavisolibacter sp.]MBD0349827.1 class I SAM-dependent methyltransferase [Flavisolibacter sp.]MBD0374828.1 class I SAM-dependent methyltransferase [Flavisolibacter sp.]